MISLWLLQDLRGIPPRRCAAGINRIPRHHWFPCSDRCQPSEWRLLRFPFSGRAFGPFQC